MAQPSNETRINEIAGAHARGVSESLRTHGEAVAVATETVCDRGILRTSLDVSKADAVTASVPEQAVIGLRSGAMESGSFVHRFTEPGDHYPRLTILYSR